MAAISVVYRAPTGEEQPKVTDWMQGWGSIAGVVAGLAAAGAAAWLLMHERQEAQRARAELAAERADAELVGPRLVVATDPVLYMYDETSAHEVAVTVRNFGPMPILRVFVVVSLFPGAEEMRPPPANVIPPLSGERRFVAGFEDDPIKLPHSDQVLISQSAKVVLYFTDAAGQGWRKTKNGQPEKVRFAVPPPPKGPGLSSVAG